MKRIVAVASALGASVLLAGSAPATLDVVTTRETAVRSAPFDVAPEIVRAAPDVHFVGADQAEGAWRRVQLPDGRFGYLHESDVTSPGNPVNPAVPAPDPHPHSLAVAAVPPTAAAPVVTAAPVQSSQTAAPSTVGPTLAGVMFSILPVGTLSRTASNVDDSIDAFFAVAVAVFVDAPVSRHLSLGLSPQAVFRVNGNAPTKSSATELDFRGRITGRMPLSQATAVFARLSPAFSVLSMPQGAGPDPKGFLMDVSVGTEVALLPNLFLVVELGYQAGFQTLDAGNGLSFDGTRYLHLGGGLAIGL
jgi:hypothetical protein